LEQRVKELEKETVERKPADEKIEHLNAVLRAIRNVNQLIITEKDRGRLLKGACDTLVEARGYYNAWIALLDESGELVTTSEAGLGKDFLPMVERLKRGELTDCGRMVLSQSHVVVTQDPPSNCPDCPLSGMYSGRGGMTVRLKYNRKIYGLLCASIPIDLTSDEEEQALFKELSSDIAFALYGVELDEERKRAEKALRESEEKYKTLVESSLTGIFTHQDGEYVFVNDRFAEIHGYESEELLGREYLSLIHPDERDGLGQRALDRVKGEAVPQRYEVRRLGKNGKAIPCEMMATRIEYGGKPAIMGNIVDITKRKRAEEALQKAYDELEKRIEQRTTELSESNALLKKEISSRKRAEEELRNINEELKNFAYIVSHDLKTPIANVQGFSSLLLENYQEGLGEKARMCLERIAANSRRMEVLVSDLLTLSRIGQVVSTFKDVSFDKIVEDVVSGLQPRLEDKGIKLTISDKLPTISCDAERICQVFENLLVNAIKFVGYTNNPKIEIGYEDREDVHEFCVKDNGIGIDPKYHEKIFETFYQSKETEDDEGTGLGLVIVERIVNKHGGRVWVESEPGKGSTFYFTIPAAG
jgi:PAS domain S-box-containing protein